jgi:integrase
MQKGTIRRVGNCWLLRYYEPVLVDGKIVKKAKAKKLATYDPELYRTEEDVRPLADLILAPINARTAQAESTQTVASFLEHVYLPYIRETKKPSTVMSYAVMLKLVKPYLGRLELRQVRTVDVDRILKAIADSKPRAHTTLRNAKTFLSGGFRYAKRVDAIRDNPVRDSVVPRGLPARKTPAYTLEQIQQCLKVIPEPARTAALVAGLTGLRVGEVKGLRWSDIVADELHISRSVWSGHVTDTKTLTSRAPIPLLPLVKRALAAHRNRTTGDGYIFHGRNGNPLRLENVVRRDIMPALKKAGLPWLGWHAFRRGVGTNLHDLGVDDLTISQILRHGDVGLTQALYIKPVGAKSQKAMKRLEAAFKKAR